MALFAVSYQLNKSKDYQPLWDAFTELDAHKAMKDFYLIENNATTKQLGEHLARFLDADDYLFVTPFVSKPYKVGCFKGTQAWLDAQFG